MEKKVYDLSRPNPMPWADQIAANAPCVHTYFWVTIYYKNPLDLNNVWRYQNREDASKRASAYVLGERMQG